MSRDRYAATHRFGLGPHPEDWRRIGRDPRGWLMAQASNVENSRAVPVPLRALPSAPEILATAFRARRTKDRAERRKLRRLVQRELMARTRTLVRTDVPFRERWVLFWANHFTVSGSKRFVAPAIGAFEREAIRPHAFGRFEDMLQAVCAHPAMLIYLDNDRSVGELSLIHI